MKINITILFTLFLYSFAFAQHNHANHTALNDATQNIMPPVKQGVVENHIKFVENKNQWDNSVKFRADIPSGFLFFKEDGLQYVLLDMSEIRDNHANPNAQKSASNQSNPIKGHAINITFQNTKAFTSRTVAGINPYTDKKNYFLGNDSKKWATDVKSYGTVFYPEIYDKIGLKFYEKENSLKYEFIVAPKGNTNQIALKYEGANSLKIDNEKFVINTDLGDIIEQKPYCYQNIGGKQVTVNAKYVLQGDVMTFEFMEGYDENYELIIDPTLVFSTYSGSTADNWGSTATFDEAGNLYSGGVVFGAGFPIRPNPGAFDGSFNGGITDIGILKFNPAGTSLIYSTYLGGGNSEFAHSLIVNQNNELYVLGTTSSNNYPTANGFQSNYNGGTNVEINGISFSAGTDIVISRFNANGTALLNSTYLGGSGNDGINTNASFSILNYGDQFRGDIFIDPAGAVYIASTTNSSNFPRLNAFQNTLSGGQDGVVVKMNASLNALIWSSYLGGSSIETAYSIKVNTVGDVYICGATRSTNLRTGLPIGTPAAFNSNALGNDDGYIAKISSTGILQQITYLGTINADQAYFADIDPNDESLYVVGLTFGAYPTTATGVYKNANSGQFIQKLNADLTQGLLATVIGRGDNNPDISPTAFLVNDCGNIYLTGWGSSLSAGLTTNGLPTTTDAYARTTDGNDFYIIILQKNLQSLLYATFFGGNGSGDHVDGGTCRFDKEGIIYHAACASCGGFDNNFPTTPGAWSSTNNSPNCNNAAFKFDIGSLNADFDLIDPSINTIIANACRFPIDVLFDFEGNNVTEWEWYIDDVLVSTQQNFTFNFTQNGIYEVMLIAKNSASCLKADTTVQLFPVSVIGIDASYAETICFGQSIQLTSAVTSTNPYTFQWSPATTLANANTLTPTATPTQTTVYTLTATDENGCIAQKTVTVNVIPPLNPDFDIRNNANAETDRICLPATATLNFNGMAAGAESWFWEIEDIAGSFNNQAVVNFNLTNPKAYTVKLTATRGGQCPETKTLEKELFVSSMQVEAFGETTVCRDILVPISAVGNSSFGNILTYQWSPSTGLSATQGQTVNASPDGTTTYTVTATNEYGCTATDQVTVNIAQTPRLDFDITLSTDCAKPTTITFENNTTEATNFEWTISNGGEIITQFFEQTPAPYDFVKAGTYEITIRAYTGDCEKIETRTLEIENNLSLPPNAISPDDDNESLNEVFYLDDRIGYKLEVFNRWGGLIFKSDAYQNDWGKDAENGLYYYLLTSPSGIKCKGWVQVFK